MSLKFREENISKNALGAQVKQVYIFRVKKKYWRNSLCVSDYMSLPTLIYLYV